MTSIRKGVLFVCVFPTKNLLTEEKNGKNGGNICWDSKIYVHEESHSCDTPRSCVHGESHSCDESCFSCFLYKNNRLCIKMRVLKDAAQPYLKNTYIIVFSPTEISLWNYLSENINLIHWHTEHNKLFRKSVKKNSCKISMFKI